MNYYKEYLIYAGEHYSVYFHAEEKSDSKVYDYFERCEPVTQASLLFLIQRIADTRIIYDKTKFRIEDKKNKIYAFKPRKERFFCFFFSGKTIIITSAYRKKRQKLDRRELGKTIRIRDQYLKGR